MAADLDAAHQELAALKQERSTTAAAQQKNLVEAVKTSNPKLYFLNKKVFEAEALQRELREALRSTKQEKEHHTSEFIATTKTFRNEEKDKAAIKRLEQQLQARTEQTQAVHEQLASLRAQEAVLESHAEDNKEVIALYAKYQSLLSKLEEQDEAIT